MVVRALKDLGADRVRVNNRHDIVLDTVDGTKESEISLKVSGSAYKLTRKRSLHHGTCLLCSPHLKLISKFLDSPAKPFIKTRGVDSVRSRITNLGFTNEDFQKAVIQQFCSMYSFIEPIAVGEDLEEILEIGRGTAELKSNEWIYGQTPQFTFTIEGASEYPSGTGKSLAQTLSLPNSFRLEFTARHGRITEVSPPFNYLLERDLHEITDWRLETSTSDLCDTFETQKIVGSVLNQLFR
ncbi:hypothetical protein K3495_g801 [Podosphaera aphanis]|nr:hypothetical protein K3495_g801 [Podosphaera aphanis]